MLYYKECYAKLPEIALKYAEMVGNYSADIFDNDKNEEGIAANTCEYDLHDSDYDDEEEVDIDPRIPVVPKKAVDRVDGVVTLRKKNNKDKTVSKNTSQPPEKEDDNCVIPKKTNNKIPRKIVLKAKTAQLSKHDGSRKQGGNLDDKPPHRTLKIVN